MKNKITTIVVVAFLFRFILLLIDNFWFNLPQSGADSVRFDRTAYDMSLSSTISVLDVITSGAKFHVWLGSLLYSVFGRVPFIWGFIMVLFGTGTVYNIHRGAYLVSENYQLANRSAWIAALFPNFAVLSAIILREAPIYFFVSLALVYFIRYIKFNSFPSILKFFVFGIIGSAFHSAVFALFIGFIFYNVVLNRKSHFMLKVLAIGLSIGALYLINQTGIGLSKFGGSLEGALDGLAEGGGIAEHGNTNYPSWLHLTGSPLDIVLYPIRIVAFLFAPFIPFFAKSASHLIGVFDGILYFLIIRSIYLSRKILFKNEMSKAMIVVALSVIIAFSFGASNFGTNIRHRAKVLPILLFIPLLNKRERKYSEYLAMKKGENQKAIIV